jgi:hypothetical protein
MRSYYWLHGLGNHAGFTAETGLRLTSYNSRTHQNHHCAEIEYGAGAAGPFGESAADHRAVHHGCPERYDRSDALELDAMAPRTAKRTARNTPAIYSDAVCFAKLRREHAYVNRRAPDRGFGDTGMRARFAGFGDGLTQTLIDHEAARHCEFS